MSELPTRLLLLFATLAISACTTIQRDPVKVESQAYAAADDGVLAEVSRDAASRFGTDQSVFHLLTDGESALNWRLALIDHATQSIDIQYYLWNDDEAGKLVLARLLEAAERGVRVRILVDDFLFTGDEELLASVCYHPNLEIRLFNPSMVRTGTIGQLLEYVVDWTERNRRMHNKLFVVDGLVAIMGGRNIGNGYFGMGEKYNFVDLDVMTAGAVVPEISRSFDHFWNSDPAYPGQALSRRAGPERTAEVIDTYLSNFAADPGILPQTAFPMARKDWSRELRSLRALWHPGHAVVASDAPVVRKGEKRERFLDDSPSLTDPDNPQELFMVTPYLIPGEEMFQQLEEFHRKGVKVTVLVPGMDSNNQALVHSHYKKYRRRLLASGVDLYEFRKDPSDEAKHFTDVAPARNKTVALHLKGVIGDRQRCFIGSLNFDPRSIEINTENGLFIESPSLAGELVEHFEKMIATENAWRVSSDGEGGKGQLRWRSMEEERTIQPAPGVGSRVADFIFGLLPIKSLL